jgi:hypothetical protein
MLPGGPVRQPFSYSVPSPHRLFKNSSTDPNPALGLQFCTKDRQNVLNTELKGLNNISNFLKVRDGFGTEFKSGTYSNKPTKVLVRS